MLILARKNNESIIIGDHIKVTVLEIQGDNVKLGIDAPNTVKILREELYKAVREENVKAGSTGVDDALLGGLDQLLGGGQK